MKNQVKRTISRDCVSYGVWSLSDTSGYVLDVWSRQIQNQGYASVRIAVIRLDREYFG